MTASVRWTNPDAGMLAGPHTVDRLFEQLFGYGNARHDNGTPTYALPIDIVETEDAYQLYATVAGVPQDSVEVTFENGVLSLTVPAAPLELKGNLVRHERPWGNWSRKLELPKEVDPANIVAEFDNGVLTVRVPKVAKAAPQRIVVRTADRAITADTAIGG
jgi:HSP20 family protein